MSSRVLVAACALALTSALPVAVCAAPAASPNTELSAAQRKTTVEAVCEVLQQSYIFEDVANDMARLARKNLKSGAYDDLTLGDLAQRLTQDLRSVSHDKHLRIDPLHEIAEEDPVEEERLLQRYLEEARRDNYGFRKVEMLGGNIGYLRLDQFYDASIGGETAIAAMNLLANADALIIDLRTNGGGSPSMIQLISSYFFDEPRHLNTFYIRKDDETKQFWTQASVEGKKLVDTPIYVLTSGYTFSAAEEFTYNLKNMERATIIGQKTGGGAHPVYFDHRPDAMVTVKVPYGRAINPITKTNWEGTGIEPHIAAPVEDALTVASLEATKRLAADATDDQERAVHQWALEQYETYLEPATVDVAQLASCAGTYGPRVVEYDGTGLRYQRDGSVWFDLIPMGDDRFAFRRGDEFSNMRIQFERDPAGSVTHFVLTNPQGARIKSESRSTQAMAGNGSK